VARTDFFNLYFDLETPAIMAEANPMTSVIDQAAGDYPS
jgi:hypothetical protein